MPVLPRGNFQLQTWHFFGESVITSCYAKNAITNMRAWVVEVQDHRGQSYLLLLLMYNFV